MTHSRQAVLLCGLALFCAGRQLHAQCLLINPSFELPGGSGETFAGWDQFGDVGPAASAAHGSAAAAVVGIPGDWNLSGVWQARSAAPDERWTARGCVWNSSTAPLTGAVTAIVNIEWRAADDQLIDFESHVVADSASIPDHVQSFEVISGPAPIGTVSARLLCGLLQSPLDPSGAAGFDALEFEHDDPSLDDLQWPDFPGGREIVFGGRSWRVKGPGLYGPGPNEFSDAVDQVWVDSMDRLHLNIQNLGAGSRSSEVVLEDALGYGDYRFTTVGRLDDWHPHVVFGLFLWQYPRCYDPADGWWNPYNEIDIEFSRWGDPAADVAQFVAQPYDYPGNIERFDVSFSTNERTTHAMRWLADRVEYRSWRGGPDDESSETMIHDWTYTGAHVARAEQPRVHLNLWHIDAAPTTAQTVVLERFEFVAAADPHVAEVPSATAVGLWVFATVVVVCGAMICRRRHPPRVIVNDGVE
jgi:hypothetical protein